MNVKKKKFLFITLNKNLYDRQKYIIDILKENINIEIFFLEDIFKNYSFFFIKGFYQNSFWPDSYSFYYNIFKKIFLENINPQNYSGLIVTYDWSASIKRTIEIFKENDIPTFNILHEGFYININDWYNMNKYLPIKLLLKTNKKLNIPITQYTFVWWNIHKNEFLKRGYKGYIKNIGTFKFEKYNKLKINKKELIKKLNIKTYKKDIFLYVFQILEENKIHYQYNIINDLIKYCKENNNILIIRNQLGYNLDLSKININNNVYIDGLKKYKISAEDAILLADYVFAINSTMLLEAIYNNKKALSFKYFNFKSSFLNNKLLPFINNKEEIGKKIKQINNNFLENRKIELKKIKLEGNINFLISELITKSNLQTINKFKSNTKKYYLKYFYLIINPFLIKNFFQSLIIYIKVKLGKKY